MVFLPMVQTQSHTGKQSLCKWKRQAVEKSSETKYTESEYLVGLVCKILNWFSSDKTK